MSRSEVIERIETWRRHVVDLQMDSYEGAVKREERETVFEEAFRLTTPVALRSLERLSVAYLGGTGASSVRVPRPVLADELEGAWRSPTGGLLGSWDLTWPALERARSRLTGEEMPPVQIFAMFPQDFTHPHLALFDLSRPRNWVACWPFHVLTTDEADGLMPTLSVIAEAEMHERTFASDLNWRLLDI